MVFFEEIILSIQRIPPHIAGLLSTVNILRYYARCQVDFLRLGIFRRHFNIAMGCIINVITDGFPFRPSFCLFNRRDLF